MITMGNTRARTTPMHKREGVIFRQPVCFEEPREVGGRGNRSIGGQSGAFSRYGQASAYYRTGIWFAENPKNFGSRKKEEALTRAK